MQTFHIGQKALISKDGKILILLRDQVEGRKGFWDLPGGRVDWGENLAEALRRGVKEEAGLEIAQIIKPLTISTFRKSVDQSDQIIRIIYHCSASGTINLCPEHSKYLWVTADQYLTYKFPDQDYQTALYRLLHPEDESKDYLDNFLLN